MVTTAPNSLIGTITDRMAAIPPLDVRDVWLGETDAPPDESKKLLVTVEVDRIMEAEKKASAQPKKLAPAQPSLF